jgi:hypothetical protein
LNAVGEQEADYFQGEAMCRDSWNVLWEQACDLAEGGFDALTCRLEEKLTTGRKWALRVLLALGL